MLEIESTSRADARMDGAVTVGAVPRSSAPLFEVIHPLRPLHGTEPLDLGLAVFRGAAERLIPLTVLVHLPILAVDLWLRLRWGGGSEATTLAMSGIPIALLWGDNPYGPLVVLVQSVALSMVGIAAGMLVGATLEGNVVGSRTVIVSVLRRAGTAFAITVLGLLVHLVTSCVPVVGLLAAGTATFTASVVAGAEGVGPWRALRRSLELAGANPVFAGGLFIGGLSILTLVRIILMLGPLALVAMMGLPDPVVSALMNLTGTALVVLQPLTAAMAAAAYLALRVRAEGLDLWERTVSIGGAR